MKERIQDRFGRNLAAARAHRRLGQKDVAANAGVDQSYLSFIEAGKRTVSIEVAEKLARAVGVSVGILLDAREPFAAAPAALDRETNPPAPSPASPECRHGRTRVDCSNGETDATCLDCGAVWLDDGQGWRAATAQEGSDGT